MRYACSPFPTGYGAPPDQGYGAPPDQGYGAPPPDQGYGQPPPQGYGQPPPQGYVPRASYQPVIQQQQTNQTVVVTQAPAAVTTQYVV